MWAVLDAIAIHNPSLLNQFIKTSTRGAAIRFHRSGVVTWVDVALTFPYAQVVRNEPCYGYAFEKAYAYFRKGLNTYASLAYGSPSAVMRELGFVTTSLSVSSATDLSIFSAINNTAAARLPMTVNTKSTVNTRKVVASHVYAIRRTWKDSAGVYWVELYNPWGYDHVPDEANDGFIRLTYPEFKANFNTIARATKWDW
jgi:hypothetical protein